MATATLQDVIDELKDLRTVLGPMSASNSPFLTVKEATAELAAGTVPTFATCFIPASSRNAASAPYLNPARRTRGAHGKPRLFQRLYTGEGGA